MKRLKRFWWLLKLGEERVRLAWDHIESMERQQSAMLKFQQEQSGLIIALTSEVNDLRNAMQHQPLAQRPANIRQARNWREFADAASHPENPKAIELRKA